MTDLLAYNYQSLIPLGFFKSLLPLEYNTLSEFLYVDFSKWDWSQLLPSQDFKWVEGVTPFSNKNFLYMVSFGFVFLVYLCQFLLKNKKEAFSVRTFSIYHNLFISLWSLVMCVGVVYDVALLVFQSEHGINAIFCSPKSNPLTGRIYYWHYLYFLSKFYEYVDTFILVLKKRNIIFLHIWHHFIVGFIVWTWFTEGIAYGSVGLFANTLVHVFMYYFYFRTALNPSARIWWKKYLTSGQIFQFSISFVLAIPALVLDIKVNPKTMNFEHSCTGYGSFVFTMMNNFIFLILFVQFFLNTYIPKRKVD